MIKKKHQLRFGKELYIVENMDKDNYLLRNLTTNDIEWVSKKNISEALEKITFNQSSMEYSSQNDFIKISLLENGDSTTIDINDGTNHYYKSYKNGKTKVLEQFTKKFNYFNELTPQKLLNNGFTTTLNENVDEYSVDKSCELYKDIYLNKLNGSKMFLERASSPLTGMRWYLKELKEEYPNSLNIPYYITEEKMTYWNRIAGFYNPNTNELDDNVKHQKEHQNADEMLENGWIRFFICDLKHRCCFLSAIDKETAIKGYKFLKNHYKSLNIEYFQIDWTDGDITYDYQGKKIQYDELYEQFKKHLLPLMESFGGQIFYHGSHTKNIKNFEGNVFWSTTLDFAEQYGPIIYKAQLNLGNCFNISIKQHFNWLLKQVGGKIVYKDENEEECYLFDFNDYCKICHNNWETVEQYLDIIKGSYDSCQIVEEDIVNYIVFNNNQIRLIDVFNRQLDESKQNNSLKLLDESYEQDKEYRALAKKLADIITKKINSKDEMLNTEDDLVYDVTKEFYKASDLIKNSGKQYAVIFSQATSNDGTAAFAPSKDETKCYLFFPILSLPNQELMVELFKKNKKAYQEFLIQYTNAPKEERPKILHSAFIKLAKKYVKKRMKHFTEERDDIVVHECIHLIDYLRRTKGYIPAKQDISTEKGKANYYNSPEEQNAYYQETVHNFDHWINQDKSGMITFLFDTNDFREFFKAFVQQYQGDYSKLNKENKVKIAKRVYQYWLNAFEINSNKSFKNRKTLGESVDSNISETPITKDEIEKFKQINNAHRASVNKYGAKVGKSYPKHDLDKLKEPLLTPYVKGFVRGKEGCTDKEWEEFKNTQDIHYKNNSHHSQYWDKSWQHDGQMPIADNKMNNEAIIEMCADWCSMSEHYGNTPFEWADENIGKLWHFDKHQIDLIYKTLKQMWSKSNNDKPINESIDDKIEIKNEQADDKFY